MFSKVLATARSTLLVGLLATAPAQTKDEPITLPRVDVEASRLESFATRVIMGPGESFRIILQPARTGSAAPVYLAGDLRYRDEIVRINGRDLSSFKRNEWTKEFFRPAKITVRRRVAIGKYDLIEVDCVMK